MKLILKTLLLSLLTVASVGIHTAVAQQQIIQCNTSTGAACNISTNPGDGTQGDPAWLSFGKTNVNFNQIFSVLGPNGALPAPLYGLEFNNNGALGSLLPGSTGTWCLDWTSLTAAPTLISCAGGGTVTSIGLTVPSWLSSSPASITSSGTFAISGTIEPNNEVLASAATGTQTGLAPRALVAADIPVISASTGLSGTLQAAQEPAHTGDVTNTAGSLATTVGKVNGLPIPPSSSLVGTNSSSQFVAVTTPLSLALGGTGTASPAIVAGSNISVTGTFPNQTINANIGSSAFTALTTGTNTTAAMTVGTGSSLGFSGAGTINATNTVDVNGATVPASALVLGSNSIGQLVLETTTGTGFSVLSTSPTLVTPTLGAATATSINGTAIPASATLLVNGGALGTPSSATLTNATGLPTSGLTGTLLAAQEPAHTGDVTNTAGSLATTVVKVNGGALPISASVVGTNSLGQIVVGSAGGGGTVTTSGTPAAGNLTKFSGATAVTNADLSGDVTTSGTLAATVVKVNGAAVPVSASVLGSNSSGQFIADTTTGTGNAVLSTSPTLVTPALGTPSTLVLTNATGLPNASVIGLGTFATANAATPPTIGGTTPAAGSFSSLTDTGVTGSIQCLHVSSAGLISGTGVDCGTGSGSAAFNAITGGTNTSAAMLVGTGASLGPSGSGTVTANTLSSGIALGTPASGVLTNATGLPLTTGVTGLLPVTNGGTGTATPSLVAGSNITITGSWPNQTVIASVTGATAFSALTSSSNTTAAMVVGTGASIAATGSGSITATAMPTSGLTGTLAAGQEPAHTGDMTNTAGSLATTVKGINGTLLSGLATGILKNTTTSGAPSIAVAADFPTLNQSTTGNAATASALAALGTQCTGGQFSTGITVAGNANCGTPAGAGNVSNVATPTSGQMAQWTSATTIQGVAVTGTGSAVLATSPTLVTPTIGVATATSVNGTTIPASATLLTSGGALGTPSSGTLTSATGLPISTGVSGLGTGVATFLATPTSANLAAAVTGETGTGAVVFATSPTLVTPNIGAATATGLTVNTITGSTQCLQVNTSGVVAGSGAGCGATLPSQADQTVLGNGSGASAAPVALTLSGNLVATATGLGTSQAINPQTGTSYAVLTTDAGKLITFSNASAVAVSLSVATTTGFTAGFSFDVQNKGAGTVTITPTTSTVNGSATLVLTTNQGCTVLSDGTNYQVSACTAVGGGGGGSGTVASSTTGQIPVYTGATTVTGGANATLTAGALTLGVSGTAGSVKMGNATSGTVTLQPATGALGAVTASLPANTGTIAETNLAETFSALQTFGTSISIGGVTATGATGSGSVVFASSPTLTTPALGTPSAAVLTNATGLPVAGIASIAANTVVANATGSTAIPTAVTAPNILGLINSPTCNAQTGTTYTLVLGDANGCVTMNNAASNVATFPTNASVAIPVGSTVTVEQLGAGITTISPASGVTFQSVQNGTSGTISYALLGPFDYAQFKQISANTWLLTVFGPGRGTFVANTSVTFTLGTGTGACATTSTLVGGATAGSFACTGTAGASTQPIVLPAAPHGWACHASDVTSGVAFAQSTTSTTGCTVKGTTATTGDVVVFSAIGY